MNIDEELQRMFTDERLDVPIRHDAVDTLVAGARRRRRRRRTLTASSAVAAVVALVVTVVALVSLGGAQSMPPARPPVVTVTVTVTVTAAPPASDVIGPSGYRELHLGMTAVQAEATGLIVANAQPVSGAGCLGYDYAGSPNEANHYSVLISPTLGVVRVDGRAGAVTPEGARIGTSESELKRLYPTRSGSHGAAGEWVAAIPANADARYWFIVQSGSVAEIRLEGTTQDCYA